MADDLEAALRAYHRAQAGVPAAQAKADRVVAEARQEVVRARDRLGDAIADAAREGVRQKDIVRITGYTRERIRQICRARGVEPPGDDA